MSTECLLCVTGVAAGTVDTALNYRKSYSHGTYSPEGKVTMMSHKGNACSIFCGMVVEGFSEEVTLEERPK